MASPRGSAAAALVRPVTARTWQALASAPAEDSPRRVSLYTNDLYRSGAEGGGGREEGTAPRPASPLLQAATAAAGRPSTPTPKTAERLQQQRIATPSRLQAERGSSSAARLQQLAGAGLSTTNVPAAPASPSRQQRQRQGEEEPGAQRPGTAPAQPSPLRTSTISLAALKPAPPAPPPAAAASPRPSTAGPSSSSIAADSPRVRQQLLRNFAGAVPAGATTGAGAGSTSSLGTSPRPTLHGERASGSGGVGARPSTPSFRPIAQPAARPATALAGPSAAAAGSSPRDHFSIKASYLPAPTEVAPPAGAYPRPPMTAPPKAPAQEAAEGGQQAAAPPGSLASYGIAAGAFVAVAPKGTAAGEQGPPLALTQADMLAMARMGSLRWAQLACP